MSRRPSQADPGEERVEPGIVAQSIFFTRFVVQWLASERAGRSIIPVSFWFFSIGGAPLGARWIQEHYLTFPGDQETFSYYGPMNVLALNVGYHNEHHDLMRVPCPAARITHCTLSLFISSLLMAQYPCVKRSIKRTGSRYCFILRCVSSTG